MQRGLWRTVFQLNDGTQCVDIKQNLFTRDFKTVHLRMILSGNKYNFNFIFYRQFDSRCLHYTFISIFFQICTIYRYRAFLVKVNNSIEVN